MGNWLDRHYFMLKRLNSLLGIVPVGAFFIVHMAFNSRAGQGPEQYQWVPDTLDQVPYLLLIEVFGILLPILTHAVLGVWIATRSDYHSPKAGRAWYSNVAFYLQRFTGIALFVLIAVHVWQTWWQHFTIKARGEEFDIYGTMHALMASPLWLTVYALFVLIAAWHFGNGIYNFCFKYGLTTSTASQRWALGLGLAIGLLCAGLGFTSLWGLSLSDWAREWSAAAAGYVSAGR